MYTQKSQYWLAALSILARLAVFVILVVCATSCYDECTISNADGFSYSETAKTPGGISVDERGEDIDLVELDRIVDNLDECLLDAVPRIAEWQRKHASCDKDAFNGFNGIDRAAIRVRIDEDWKWSQDRLWQLTSAKAPASSCEGKGMDEHADECRWRSAIQGCDTIIVGPRLDNIADPLTRIVLGCDYVWNIPALASCISDASREKQ
jgi:hypothetical protein